jgi:hypothetical protein
MNNNELVAEKPAEGVLKTGDFGDAMYYHIRCDCGNEDCAHELEIEADDAHVQVHIHYTQHTKWWERHRWSQIWQIITKGYAEMQTSLVMNEQVALNYAETLKSAVKDVKQFKEKAKNERLAAKKQV